MRRLTQYCSARLSVAATVILLAGAVPCSAVAQETSEKLRPPLAGLLPTSGNVPLLLYDRLSPEERRIERAMYDDARARMIKADIDPVFASDVLQELASGRGDLFRARGALAADTLNRPRPTLAKLLCDRQALDAIRVAIDREYLVRLEPHRRTSAKSGEPDREIVVTPLPPASAVVLAARDMFNRVPLPDYLGHRCPEGTSSHVLQSAPRWKTPVRIAATGFPGTDAMISKALVEIRRRVPHAPIDELSFPAARSAANVFFTASGGGDVLDRCFGEDGCDSLSSLTDDRPARASARDRAAFLDRVYFTLSYAEFAAADASLVEVSAGGNILGALCAAPLNEDPVAQSQLTSCLAQALGAYPLEGTRSGGSQTESDKIVASAFSQLLTLYP